MRERTDRFRRLSVLSIPFREVTPLSVAANSERRMLTIRSTDEFGSLLGGGA